MDDFETAVAEARQEAPPDQDWDAFVAALYSRAREAGLPDEQVSAFLTEVPPSDDSAWCAFRAEHGSRWDGLADTWLAFREWFAYVAGEQGLSSPAGQFLDYVSAADNQVAAMQEYGVVVNPLAGFPLLDRLVTYPLTREGMWQFAVDMKRGL